MGKRLRMRIAAWLALIGLLLVAGCADGGNNPDDAKNGGFYSGMSGGWSHP
jgi:hypothetical protein